MLLLRLLPFLFSTLVAITPLCAHADLAEQAQPKGWLVCPPAKQLVKNPATNLWSVPKSNFIGHDVSLLNKVDHFSGAQWLGAGIGQILCVYQGDNDDFPVVLAFQILTYEPSDGHWQKNQGGYRNCTSEDPNDCAFQLRVQPKIKNVYQEALDLKSATPNP